MIGSPIEIERVAALFEKARELGTNQRLRRIALLVAAVVFVGGIFLSIQLLPAQVELVAPRLLVKIAIVGVPVRFAIAVWELKINASLAGASLNWSQATRTSLVASAANLLPLPGGPLVRVAALNIAGGTVLKSSAITFFSALVWLGLAFCFGGYFVLANNVAVAGVFLVIGGIALVVSGFGLCRLQASWRLAGFLLLSKAAAIAIGLVRLNWAFAALGIATGVRQLAVFAISGVSGAIIAIVPGGLGISESVAAGVAPLVGLAPSTAFLAVSLNRLVGLPVLAGVTLIASSLLRHRAGDSRES